MGSQVLRPAVFPDVLLNKTSVKDALMGVRLRTPREVVNGVLRPKTSVCCVFEQQCSNMRSDFKQLRKLRGIF